MEGPAPTSHAGDQGNEVDKVQHGCRYIPHHIWNTESLWWWRVQEQIEDLVEDIIHLGNIHTEWEESIIIFLHTDKGIALDWGD